MNRYKIIIRGLISYIPFLYPLLKKGRYSKGTGGTNSARYCYSIWMRHLIHLYNNGIKEIPKVIAELGPGDSLGIGLAALISGSSKYYAFDIIEHSHVQKNLKIFDDLVVLFKHKTSIPGNDEFPLVKPILRNYNFPTQIFNKINYDDLLRPERLNDIRNAIIYGKSEEFTIRYIVPWYDGKIINKGEIDLIFSQAVLEHVLELDYTYKKMYEWLRNGGYISHEIDYSAHETSTIWNGHWAYPSFLWKIIMHGRSYPINRIPHSIHKKLIIANGLKVITELPTYNYKGYGANQVYKNFKYLSQEDFSIQSCFLQASK